MFFLWLIINTLNVCNFQKKRDENLIHQFVEKYLGVGIYLVLLQVCKINIVASILLEEYWTQILFLGKRSLFRRSRWIRDSKKSISIFLFFTLNMPLYIYYDTIELTITLTHQRCLINWFLLWLILRSSKDAKLTHKCRKFERSR